MLIYNYFKFNFNIFLNNFSNTNFQKLQKLMKFQIILNQPIPELTEAEKPVIEGFRKWRSENSYKFIMGDTMVFSKKFHFAGAVDALARDNNGKLILFDWKTTSYIHYTHGVG